MDNLCGYIVQETIMMIKARRTVVAERATPASPSRRGRAILCARPANKLASNDNTDRCTINKTFGIALTESTTMAKFDDNGYGRILFDEMRFCPIRLFFVARISKYCACNPTR